MHLPIRAKQLNGLNELWSCKPEWTITTHFASVLCTTAQESKEYVLVCSCCLKATDAQDTPCQRSGTSKKKHDILERQRVQDATDCQTHKSHPTSQCSRLELDNTWRCFKAVRSRSSCCNVSCTPGLHIGQVLTQQWRVQERVLQRWRDARIHLQVDVLTF